MPELLLWFCNHSPLLFGVAFILKKKKIIGALINVGLIGQTIWIFDFIYLSFTGNTLLDVTDYVFRLSDAASFIITILVHFLGVGIAFYFTYKEIPRKKELEYSLYYIIIIYISTLLFTQSHLNINCITEICAFPQLTPPLFTLFWPVLAFLVIVIPTQGLRFFIWKKFVKKT